MKILAAVIARFPLARIREFGELVNEAELLVKLFPLCMVEELVMLFATIISRSLLEAIFPEFVRLLRPKFRSPPDLMSLEFARFVAVILRFLPLRI